jgi:hypothetical protein
MNTFIAKLVKKIKSLFPRYTLHFVEKHTSDAHEDNNFHILAYGENTPITLLASEILNNRRIKELLDPDELLTFHLRYIQNQENNSLYFIKEISREGIITLENKFQKLQLTHEEFCKEPSVMEKTAPLDIYRIVSETYLKYGRDIEKQLFTKQARGDRVILKMTR